LDLIVSMGFLVDQAPEHGYEMGKRLLNRLSALQAKRLTVPGYHADGGGLYLQINKAGNKSWVFRYTRAGKTREMGFGAYCRVPLELARDLARKNWALLAQDIDPVEQRRQKRLAQALAEASAVTFRQAALECLDRKKGAWRDAKHAQQWINTLENYAFPVFGNISVRDVDTGHVMRVLEPIWIRKHPTATRVRERIEAVLDAAKTQGLRTGENPARWRGHLENLLSRTAEVRKVNGVHHHAALPFNEIGHFMASLREQHGLAAKALELTILTAARTSEVLEARWSEFDLDRKVWTVPASRIKAAREHRVPLSDAACIILRALENLRFGEHVFPGRKQAKPLSNMSMMQTLKRMGRPDLTVHGFRSTFRDWAAERTSFPREVAEMALAHSIGNAVEAAYRRGDLFEKRAKLMAAWSRYCGEVAAKAPIVAFGHSPQHCLLA
jgi:integrase